MVYPRLTLGAARAVFLSLLVALPVLAQRHKSPLKWGKLSPEEIALTTFPADSNATAVVLYDYGTVTFNQDLSIRFDRHRRIKILSEAGYDWGTHGVTYLAEDRMQTVRDVKGQTLLVDERGEVTRHKLSKKEIFEEDVDDRYERVRFTLPQLEPGAIVEYQYSVHSKYPHFLPEWQFQLDEPVLWSEYVVENPARLVYVRATRGVAGFDIEEEIDANRPAGPTKIFRFVLKDLPALREEPFMTTPADYRARISFQLAHFHDGLGWQTFMRTWDELAEELMDMNSFGKRLDREKSVRRTAEALTEGLTDPVEKLRTLYDFVRTSVTYNGEAGVFLDQDIDEVLERRTGSSPEIALLLTSLLRGAGLDAYPVLISTRSHGAIIEQYPILTQFNDVIVYAAAGGEEFLLDATNPLRPYDLLPISALNGKGWLVREGGAEWVPIRATGRLASHASVRAALDASGELAGTIEATDAGYGALRKRHALKGADDEAETLRGLYLDGYDAATLEDYAIEHRDSVEHPINIHGTFTLPAYAQAAGDFLYLNPTVLGRLEKNPLTLEARTFPVDFAYPFDFSYAFQITLPDGYGVQELPEAVRYTVPSGDALFLRAVKQTGRDLLVQTRFRTKKPVFGPREYAALRAFYDQVVAAQGAQVVLRRLGPDEAAAQGEGPAPADAVGGQ